MDEKRLKDIEERQIQLERKITKLGVEQSEINRALRDAIVVVAALSAAGPKSVAEAFRAGVEGFSETHPSPERSRKIFGEIADILEKASGSAL